MKTNYRNVCFFVITAAVMVGAPAIFGCISCSCGEGKPLVTQNIIMTISVGIGGYICTSVGYGLLLAVQHHVLRSSLAALFYLPVAALSLVIPSVLMYVCRGIWPRLFIGREELTLITTPIIMACFFIVPVFVVFTVAFFTFRWRPKDKTSEHRNNA